MTVGENPTTSARTGTVAGTLTDGGGTHTVYYTVSQEARPAAKLNFTPSPQSFAKTGQTVYIHLYPEVGTTATATAVAPGWLTTITNGVLELTATNNDGVGPPPARSGIITITATSGDSQQNYIIPVTQS